MCTREKRKGAGNEKNGERTMCHEERVDAWVEALHNFVRGTHLAQQVFFLPSTGPRE